MYGVIAEDSGKNIPINNPKIKNNQKYLVINLSIVF